MIRSLVISTLLVSSVSAANATSDQPLSAATPMVVTSDTDAYCATLSRQIDRYGDTLPQPVAMLRDQGQHLCAIGQIRSGINRLRRALMAMHGPEDGEMAGPSDEENTQ